MHIAGLNWVAILVATLAVQPIGALWYSTKLFGKAWMKEVGITEADTKDANMKLLFTIGFLGPLVSAIVLAWLAGAVGLTTLGGGALLGAVCSIALTSAGAAPHYAFSGQSLRLFLIDGGHSLAVMVVLGAIVGVWR